MRSSARVPHAAARRSCPWCPRRTAALLLATAQFLAAPARAQRGDPRLWVTDDRVNPVALSGNTLFVGGSFHYVGPNTGSFVGLDATSGAPRPNWPRVDGTVQAAASDSIGGWYIGGVFQAVAGVPRTNLAH